MHIFQFIKNKKVNIKYLNKFKAKFFERGFSLIELLIYVAISAIVIGSITSYFFNLMKTYGLAKNQVVITNNQSLLFEKLSFDLRYAEDVDDVNSIFNDDNGILVVIKNGDSYSYFLEDGKVMKSVNSSGSVAITSSDVAVKALHLEKIDTAQGKEGVNISVTIEGQSSSGGTVSKTVAGDIFVRERIVNY